METIADRRVAAPRARQPYESLETVETRLADMAGAVLGPRLAGRASEEKAWPALIAALQRAESNGHDPAELLADAADDHDLRDAASVSELLAWHIGNRLGGDASREPTAAPGSAGTADPDQVLLPWVTAPPPQPTADGSSLMPGYLADAVTVISARIGELADRALREHPAWLTMLGQPPADAGDRREWLRHVAVIAAYRDQHRVTTNDPRQMLGAYPERGRTGHKPYWHAAQSVLEARRLAGPGSPCSRPLRRGRNSGTDRDRHLQVAARQRARRDRIGDRSGRGRALARRPKRPRRAGSRPARLRRPTDLGPHRARASY